MFKSWQLSSPATLWLAVLCSVAVVAPACNKDESSKKDKDDDDDSKSKKKKKKSSDDEDEEDSTDKKSASATVSGTPPPTATGTTTGTTATGTGTTTSTTTASGSASSTATASTTATASGDSTGIPECDQYLALYAKCLPQAAGGIGQMREAYKQAASGPGKSIAASSCKQGSDALTKSGACK
ncbi:MAG: hypothetical protein U0271_25085 [Polyangiaceae bacterium]